jgi:hypothetical protein
LPPALNYLSLKLALQALYSGTYGPALTIVPAKLVYHQLEENVSDETHVDEFPVAS